MPGCLCVLSYLAPLFVCVWGGGGGGGSVENLKTNRSTRAASTGTHPSIYLKMLKSSRGKNVRKKKKNK
jgi:hypothetical protein